MRLFFAQDGPAANDAQGRSESNHMKKLLNKLLRSLWLVCFVAMPLCIVGEAFAATQYTKGDFTYSYVVGTGEARVDRYSGSDSSVNIPSSFTVKVNL